MTSRPRTAKKATQPATKKAAAKRTTGGTARKRTPRKTTPALTLVTPNDTNTPAGDTATQVDTRPRLTVRRKLFVGPWGVNEQAAIRAALDSAALRLPIPVRTWNGSQARLGDGTLLIHNPGPDRTFTAHIACPHGAIHGHPITSYRDLVVARDHTAACTLQHTEPTADDNDIQHEYDWDKAITRGVAPTAKPKPPAVFQLREGVRRAEATKADTQPLPLDEIAEGLAARAAEHTTDTAKEHPQP